MPNFPVYERRSGGAVSPVIEQFLQERERERSEQRADERLRQQLVLGATQDDIGLYNPEGLGAVRSARTVDEALARLQEAAQVANARKSVMADMQKRAQAISIARATPGADVSPEVASFMQTLTGSGLSQEQVSSGLRGLEAGVVGGEAARQSTLEARSAAITQSQKESDIQEQAQIRGEKRRAVISRQQLREQLAVSAGFQPDEDPNVVNAALAEARFSKANQIDPELVAANRGMIKSLEAKRTEMDAEAGTEEDLEAALRDLITESGATGSSLVPVLVEAPKGASSKRWFGTKYRVELRNFDQAKPFVLEAFTRGAAGDRPMQALFDLYDEQVRSGTHQWISRMAQKMTPEQVKNARDAESEKPLGLPRPADAVTPGPADAGAAPGSTEAPGRASAGAKQAPAATRSTSGKTGRAVGKAIREWFNPTAEQVARAEEARRAHAAEFSQRYTRADRARVNVWVDFTPELTGLLDELGLVEPIQALGEKLGGGKRGQSKKISEGVIREEILKARPDMSKENLARISKRVQDELHQSLAVQRRGKKPVR